MNIQCVDIGGTSIKCGQIRDGVVISHQETPTLARQGAEALFERICTLIPKDQIDAIGISTAGQVDMESGSILFATDALPGWTGMRLKERLIKRFGVPVAVENDVNAAVLGEAHYGAGKGFENIICAAYGTGIGGGVIINGELYRGSTGSAAEFGHIPLVYGGRPCACGGRGCYEEYASMGALMQNAAEDLGTPFQADRFFARAQEEGTREYEIFRQWIDYIAAGLRGLIYSFNPDAVMLGGGIMESPMVTQAVISTVKDTLMVSYRLVEILPAMLGNKAALYGAYVRVLQEMHSING